MNIHKKLLGLKFKTCQPHKMISDGWTQPYRMVLDDTNITSKYINGKWERIETKKIHPKWEKFYKLVFDESLTIWIKTNQSVINDIWLEGKSIKDGVENVYSFNQSYQFNNQLQIASKKDILKKLPTKVQRDFILSDIFK